MRRKSAALLAASVVSAGWAATAASAAGPPPPTGVGGAKVQQVATGLFTPTSFAVGGGNVFEGDGGAESKNGPPTGGGVYVLKGGKGTLISGSPQFVGGLAWHKGALYVSGGSFTGPHSSRWQILKWTGWNGATFTNRRVLYTAPKGFAGFNGVAFGANGRLYVGVDVGLTNGNDHGPARTPFVYDILSMKANGKDVKVFATGIRQPWQLAFPRGSSSPFVSDLGQDAPKNLNPPDFVLRVKQGDNYGFPHCNWIVPSKCSAYTKPFQRFGPHTDIMGVAIIGKRLYMTSFLGATGKGPGGQVLSMPLSGGTAKVVVKGFVAPVVGLGSSGGSLYVGELTGQVFRVTP
jgi:glucose/arabinose dehydrogenase